MSKVLVTGANGFLGSWVTRRLVEDGHETYALVRKSSDLSELRGIHCQLKYGDVTDLHSLLEAFQGIDAVFHLAGLIAYKRSERARMERINVEGTANVLEACRATDVKKLIYLSSVVAIGAGFTPHEIMNEESDYNIADLDLGYFETKHKAEILVQEAVRQNRIDAVILNPSTVYGPGDAKKGSRKTQIKVAQGKLHYYPSGGVNVVAVQDVVDGIMSAWRKGRKGERYILSGENLLIKDLFAMIAEAAGHPAPNKEIPTALFHLLGAIGDFFNALGISSALSRENAWSATLYHWFDSAKAQRELDFKPRPAQMAIADSVRWMKENRLLDKK
jgi:dihydroflavonol-4-reductase